MLTRKKPKTSPCQVLDPRTMGRPVHLLGRFTEQIREDLAEVFRARFNRRYRATFEIGAVSLTRSAPTPGAQRWLVYGDSLGRISFCLDRNVLLCILGYRYGTHKANAAALRPAPEPAAAESAEAPAEAAAAAPVEGANPELPAAANTDLDATQLAATLQTTQLEQPVPVVNEVPARPSEPETATEERLAALLGRQLVDVVHARIETLGQKADDGVPETPKPLADIPNAAALEDAWTLRAEICERTHGVVGSVWFRLDENWMNRLLKRLAPLRKNLAQSGTIPAVTQPLPARLPLTLVARLLEKQVHLGTLLDMKIGDVIPISVGTSDVLIGDSRLFTATVAENKGKLWLTSFEDVE